ncbi:helix-turn-helix domain-containing protein [Limibacter armeniacum]|uniref:helix-turn-helix domain-containing protein n=1 Tax=Limibacter armeniacum TaxID=466084 RepID=UPI0038CC06FD
MYRHLSQSQRFAIALLLKAGHSFSAIAKQLGVHRSTISREVKRNIYKGEYHPVQAQQLYQGRLFVKASCRRAIAIPDLHPRKNQLPYWRGYIAWHSDWQDHYFRRKQERIHLFRLRQKSLYSLYDKPIQPTRHAHCVKLLKEKWRDLLHLSPSLPQKFTPEIRSSKQACVFLRA